MHRHPFWVRYRVRQNLEKSMFSAILTSSKIIKHTFKMPLKPLKNKASIELDQKSQNFLKNLHKISKKSLYKFLFFLSKIRHFIILTKSKNTFPPNSHIYNVKNPNGEYISVTKNLLFFKWRKLYDKRNMERYSRIWRIVSNK